MHPKFHKTHAAAIGTAVAILAGAVSAGAQTPSVSLGIEAGPIVAGTSSDAVRQETGRQLSGVGREVSERVAATNRQLAAIQRRLRATERQLRATRQRLRTEVSDTQTRIGTSERRARQRLTRRVRILSRQVRALRRQAVATMRRAELQAIQRARSSANGAWLAVSRSGRILDQSGGMDVSHRGTGLYSVTYDVTRGGCLAVGAAGLPVSPAPGQLSVSPRGIAGLDVLVQDSRGPRDGGFYLAATC